MIPPRDINKPKNVKEEGWCAFYSGQNLKHCPYTDDKLRAAWIVGFNDASERFAGD